MFTQGFRKLGAKIENLDPAAAMKDISRTITTMMGKKVAAVKRLVETAEEMTKSYEWAPDIDVSNIFYLFLPPLEKLPLYSL